MRNQPSEHRDFFISYTAADRMWAEWVAWTLESEAYMTIIQAWDFRPGSNFVHEMQRATASAERTIAILSPNYLNSDFGASELYACFRKDPKGEIGSLVPVRVKKCELEGLLPQIIYIDLVGLSEQEAKNVLLNGVKRERVKPIESPPFPADSTVFPRGLCTLPARPKPPFPPDIHELGEDFVWISPGRFFMGSPEYEQNRHEDETQHEVTLSKGFYMCRHEVTQQEFSSLMGNNPSRHKMEPSLPVEQISWEDAMEYCRCRTVHDHLSGDLPANLCYVLPTEAQWEYACRADVSTAYFFGENDNRLSQYAYFNDNSGGIPHPVGENQPNPSGLFDMYGNVLEWCHDWYGRYDESPQVDPSGPSDGSWRVLRGGSWDSLAQSCRSAARFAADPRDRNSSIGFRVVAIKDSGGSVALEATA